MAVKTRDALTVTAPKGLIMVAGRIRVRRMGWLLDPHRLTCPDGHRVHEHGRIGSDGHLFCQWKAHSGAPHCGALLWILVVPGRGNRRKFYVADVSVDELRLFESRHDDIDAILTYLDATFPNAA